MNQRNIYFLLYLTEILACPSVRCSASKSVLGHQICVASLSISPTQPLCTCLCVVLLPSLSVCLSVTLSVSQFVCLFVSQALPPRANADILENSSRQTSRVGLEASLQSLVWALAEVWVGVGPHTVPAGALAIPA